MKLGDGAVQKPDDGCRQSEQPLLKVRWNEHNRRGAMCAIEVVGMVNIGKLLLVLLSALSLAGQPPPERGGPPPPGGRPGVRQRLANVKSAGEASGKMVALAKIYLEKSESLESRSPFAATRFLIAADALVHAAEHQQHIHQKEGPPPPASAEISRHVERIYFRLQQADYFVKQSADPNAPAIADLARQYYQGALRAAGNGDLRTADECAKSTDELMRALENLALSTAPLQQGRAPGKP